MPRILIIDDNVQIRALLLAALTAEGFEVSEASNGIEGLRAFQETPTDVVITDIVMPEMDGLELIKWLHRQYPELKIIVISGGGCLSAKTYLPMARRLGAVQVFTKPFVLQDLVRAAREITGKGTP